MTSRSNTRCQLFSDCLPVETPFMDEIARRVPRSGGCTAMPLPSMCVGIDAHHAATFKLALVPAPIQIQSPWIGIDFNGDAARRAGSKNFLNVDLVTGPA